MYRLSILFLLSVLTAATGFTQKNITLEEIWKEGIFDSNTVPGFNFMKDGKHYTRLERDKVQKYDLTTGRLSETIFDGRASRANRDFSGEVGGYTLSTDESKLLIQSETEPIYRHSTRARFFVFDRKQKTLSTVFPNGKIRLATFNPQADKVAFVYQNNLYYKDLPSGKIVQVTDDGKENAIINGALDWVYEEEFSFEEGFQWSPDGKRIAFYRFDERDVREFTLTNYYDESYPEYITFKYPKVGEKNSVVTVHIYELDKEQTVEAAVTMAEDYYLPRIKWTEDPQKLCVYRLNRHQNHLELLVADARSGKTTLLLDERNKYYIDEMVFDNLIFLEDRKHFVWTSERDGWHHIYLYNLDAGSVQQLTEGKWEVTELYGVDEKRGLVYFQAARRSPMQREVYALDIKSKRQKKLADQEGWNDAEFSTTFDYYVRTHSTANRPASFTVFDEKGKQVRVIEDNARLKAIMKDHGVRRVEFFSFETSEKVALNGWMIKPANFDETQQYPVFMFLYGGPGSQKATDEWIGSRYGWFQMLAQQGYLVACIDNRGTGGRGEEFKKMTYLQLGYYETIDQIEAAKYLAGLRYTDPERIGIFGWSYGGYLSSLCLLKGSDVFKAGIAVAPVTNWKWYDTIYTERFMRTLEENPEGYYNNSPVYFADRLQGSYLLIHGMGDDNVHFQHTAEMANSLIAANKQFDTYFYPNRNHSISGGNTSLHLYTKMTNFLNENLKGSNQAGKKPKPVQRVAPSEKILEE